MAGRGRRSAATVSKRTPASKVDPAASSTEKTTGEEAAESSEPSLSDTSEEALLHHTDNIVAKQTKNTKDVEMVSEEEDFEENKLLGTEEVSDDELPKNDLPETEPLSEDELLDENKKSKRKRQAKVDEAEAVSEDELPDDNKKWKRAKVVEAEAVSDDELPEEGRKAKNVQNGSQEDEKDLEKKMSDDEEKAEKSEKDSADDQSLDSKGKKGHPELEKYWKAVREDPSDFTAWTYLLMYVDQENDAEVAGEAYDAFLNLYPYCYGYWRKYADYEKRKGNTPECEKVFERGLKAIPLSVDLWLHYLNYCKSAYVEDGGDDFIRSQYDRAISTCGLEFRSDRLWESYIKWEKEKKNLVNVTKLYDRLLSIPTQGYTTHFDNFQEHVQSNVPQTILSVDDFLNLRKEVVENLKEEKTSNGSSAEKSAVTSDAPPGEEDATDETATNEPKPAMSMEEEVAALKSRIIATRKKIHKATVAAVASRWNFEEGIKRPYFHVKPLERCQLKNWKEYLDFEIEQGDEERVIILFERCLIACALYEEFWVRYIKYLESKPEPNTEIIRDVYHRACEIHHKKKPYLHLQWAAFEENEGNIEKAAEILEELDKNIPGMLQVMYRRINLERRRKSYEKVIELFDQYLAGSKSKSVAASLATKYARFAWKWLKDVEKAINILETALDKDKENPRLHLQLIDMNMQKDPVDETAVLKVLDDFLSKDADLEHKLMFAQRKIEFLEDFGSHISSVQKAQNDLQKYLKQLKEKKKKSAEAATQEHSQSMKKRHDNNQYPAGPPSGGPPASNYPPNYGGYYQPYTAAQSQDGTNSNFPNYPPNYPMNYNNWNQYPSGQPYHGGHSGYGQPGWPGSGYYSNY